MSDYERYLFRGKEKDSGKWIYGDLRHISDGHGGYILCIVDNTNGRNNDVTGVEVLPETVGQYTGFTDKNGKRIFEGDIVRATIERAERCQSPRIENGVIGYDCIGMIGLILYKDKNGENVWSDFFNELSLSGLIEDYYFEIIGNIHDNPELLGGENNGINR